MKLVAALTFGSLAAMAQAPDIATIMARVAGNQAASQAARKQFVYDEEQRVRLHRTNGKLAREEFRFYTVAPQAAEGARKLDKVEGRYAEGSKLVSYDKPGVERKGLDIDAGLTEGFFEDAPRDTVDGIPKDLFPLTQKEQAKYDYHLEGIEKYHGRQVYRVSFQPKHHPSPDSDHGDWKGEALIDSAEFQPVMVSTDLAWKMPLAVRTLLGTDIRELGFSVTYQAFPSQAGSASVWFPVTYGGEFEVRGLFFYRRNISLELINKNFRRTDVQSNVAFERMER